MEEKKQENITELKPEPERESGKKNPVFWVIVIVMSLLILAGLGYLGRMWYLDYSSEKRGKEIETYYSETTTLPQATKKVLKENPVDFESLQQTNSELYAWIKVPGTRVSYPIAQSETDDEFYLHHDYLKNYLFAGTPYTEMCNKKDFSDPVTLVYGHNMYESEGTMFTTLHSFEDKAFFDSHKTFTIYMPGRMLTYRIFSAFKFDNRHIMNSYDFEHGTDDLLAFQDTMLNPHSTIKNVRSGVTLNEKSKVVVLSTCFLGDKSVRFLVCGVLVNDEPTK
ncbi:MAG: class B sortase [Clostridia bacterium]|nr:class B sortase [Clostridia bacterium]